MTETETDITSAGGVSRRKMVYGLLAGAGLGALAVPGMAAAAPTSPRPTVPVVRGEVEVNVHDYGAKGDGSTDDTAAIQAAIDGAAESGSGIYFPAGTYVVTAPLRADGPTSLRGEGMWQTTIALTTDASFADAGTRPGVLIVEGMAFDSRGRTRAVFALDVASVHTFVFRQCRFTNIAGVGAGVGALPAAVELMGVGDGEFVDCLWHNPAQYAGQGTGVHVHAEPSGRRLSFYGNNRFLWLSYGIECDAGYHSTATLELLTVDGAYFDGYWWLLPPAYSNEGASVSYSDTTVVDTKADFSDVIGGPKNTGYAGYIDARAMPVRRTGTATSATGTSLVDSNANFIDAGALRGEIVRCPGKFAVVAGLNETDPTAVQLEEWLDGETLLPTDPPAAGTTYTLYQILFMLARVTSPTTVSLAPYARGWRDLRGNPVTPPPGTRYEVPKTLPLYHLHNGGSSGAGLSGLQNMHVTNCTFRRGFADQIGFYGLHAQVIGNVFQDGQDVGCTLEGSGVGHIVMGNTFHNQGSVAVALSQVSEAVVIGNRCVGSGWNQPNGYYGEIWAYNAKRNTIALNYSSVGPEIERPLLACVGLYGAAEDNYLFGNRSDGTTHCPDVRVATAKATGNEISGSRTFDYVLNAPAQLTETTGAGSPEGALTASVGSIYRRTDGGAGETLYVKESGAGATGWVAK